MLYGSFWTVKNFPLLIIIHFQTCDFRVKGGIFCWVLSYNLCVPTQVSGLRVTYYC